MKLFFLGAAVIGLGIAYFGTPPFSGTPTPDHADASGYSDFETGVKRHPNGIIEVGALTRMPGVSAEMVHWWFADYLQTTDHYKLWHPKAHVWMDWENKKPGEIIGASHLVHEYIGPELHKARIQFVPVEDILGHPLENDDDVAICARAGMLEEPLNAVRMCHIVRNTEFGAEMRSRFWVGFVAQRDGNDEVPSLQGLLGNTMIARRLLVSHQDGVDLMQHAIEEMGYLADFLPELYAAETAQQ
ncbi:DAPG hydrolase family protein [Shimia sp. Alg240-R146]|uniref:DAPG hydrolase family protein n=1 Tax=Shimia sp. Alg240-R146 TaxID=2993449 RepID=UPI0022E68071|nr:hypothetical protein [Shimia sp. Alg240-R146]